MPWNPDTGLWEDETSTDPTTSDVAVYDQELEDLSRLERGDTNQRSYGPQHGGPRAEADYQDAPPQKDPFDTQGFPFVDGGHQRYVESVVPENREADYSNVPTGLQRPESDYNLRSDEYLGRFLPVDEGGVSEYPRAEAGYPKPGPGGSRPQFGPDGQFQPTEAYPFDPRILEQRQQEMAQPGFQRLPPTPPTDTLYFVNPHTGRNGYFDLPQGRQGQQIVQDYQRRGYMISVNRPLDRQGNPIFTPQEQAAQAREQQMNLPFAQGDAHRLSQLEGQRAQIMRDMGRGLRPRDAMPYLREIEHQIGMLHERQQRTQANNDKMQFQQKMQEARQVAALRAASMKADVEVQIENTKRWKNELPNMMVQIPMPDGSTVLAIPDPSGKVTIKEVKPTEARDDARLQAENRRNEIEERKAKESALKIDAEAHTHYQSVREKEIKHATEVVKNSKAKDDRDGPWNEGDRINFEEAYTKGMAGHGYAPTWEEERTKRGAGQRPPAAPVTPTAPAATSPQPQQPPTPAPQGQQFSGGQTAADVRGLQEVRRAVPPDVAPLVDELTKIMADFPSNPPPDVLQRANELRLKIAAARKGG